MLRKQLLLKSLIALMAVCIATSAVRAEIVTKPVAPGIPYRLVFVTSVAVNATSTDINYYNGVVAAAAAAIPAIDELKDPWGNPVTWKAIASTVDVAAINNTGTAGTGTWDDVAIYNLGGQLVAANNAELWNGAINNRINRTETDAAYTLNVWTGTNASGTQAFSGTYNLALGRGQAGFGLASENNNKGWIEEGSVANGNGMRLYAMSSVVPEPSTLIMWTLLAGIGLAVLRRKRAAA